jgi:hypothetical protein
MALIDAAVSALKATLAGVPGDALPGTSSTGTDAGAYANRLDPWDVVVLAGRTMPGRAEVTGKGVSHQIDIKKALGNHGAVFTDNGAELGKFDIKLHMWTDAQWIAFQAIRPLLQPTTPKGKLQAVDVEHPAINGIGVRSIYVTRVGIPEVGRHEKGVVVVDIECLEFAPPPAGTGNATNTPKSSLSIASVPHVTPGPTEAPSETHTGPGPWRDAH